jgi:hypothetical protein
MEENTANLWLEMFEAIEDDEEEEFLPPTKKIILEKTPEKKGYI